ncbi:MAG: hypothetical protein GVY05_02205, partial [Bacteroidetes bacterium]|nr:hypothetical protein [Bacteroidota bacterium]
MRSISLLIMLLAITSLQAQNFETVISSYLDNSSEEFNFNRSDLQDFKISDASYSKSMDLHNVYVQQNYQNTPVLNAIGSFAIKQNRVVNFNHSFVTELDQKIETSTASLSAENALSEATNQLNINTSFELVETHSNVEFIYKSDDSAEVTPVKLTYVLTEENKLRLAWDFSILTHDESHWWSISIDANNGQILRQNDWMLSCNFDSKYSHHQSKPHNIEVNKNSTLSFVSDGSTYRAYPLGVESPNHGNRVLLNQPADATASPFGWHDTDGVAGPEFTITRGNNVLASEDRDADNIPG